jgi:hypothetical protein
VNVVPSNAYTLGKTYTETLQRNTAILRHEILFNLTGIEHEMVWTAIEHFITYLAISNG